MSQHALYHYFFTQDSKLTVYCRFKQGFDWLAAEPSHPKVVPRFFMTVSGAEFATATGHGHHGDSKKQMYSVSTWALTVLCQFLIPQRLDMGKE